VTVEGGAYGGSLLLLLLLHNVYFILFTLLLLHLRHKRLNVADTPLPHTSASWLSVNEEALFALAYSNGPILLIRMNPLSGMVAVNELKQETMVPRFLSGIAGALR
jgi:hypothetical protein